MTSSQCLLILSGLHSSQLLGGGVKLFHHQSPFQFQNVYASFLEPRRVSTREWYLVTYHALVY